MRNLKLTIAFDGTDYFGWQRQNDRLTVQETIERAVSRITNAKTSVLGCSRTDAKVHAEEYVCNFMTESDISTYKLPLALNAVMPKDVRVFRCEEVPLSFHATLDATKKTYRYQVVNAPHQNPFLRNYAWHFPLPLDLEKMEGVTHHFLGEHDFTSFMCTDAEVKTAVRTIYDLNVTRNENCFSITVSANGFLYNMVRIIAGTLVYVGCGKIAPEEIPHIIEAKDRRLAGMTAPPHGLRLIKVDY